MHTLCYTYSYNKYSCPTCAEAIDSAADSSMCVDETADVPSHPQDEVGTVELSSSTQQTTAVPLIQSEPCEPASSSSLARQPSSEDEDGDTSAGRTL